MCKRVAAGAVDNNRDKTQRKQISLECNKIIASSLSCPKQNNIKTSMKMAPSNSTRGRRINSDFDITVLPIAAPNPNVHLQPIDSDMSGERIVKPISGYDGYCGEWKEFADVISNVS